MTFGEVLVVWSVRASLLLWLCAAAGMLAGLRTPAVRWLWTLACLAFVCHVIAAFEFVHHWSHEAAYQEAERESGFGPGVFVSYAFTLLWSADVAWWWLSPGSRARRPRSLGIAWHGFMAFVIFNATVVYEEGLVRWAGLAGFALLAWLRLVRRARPRRI